MIVTLYLHQNFDLSIFENSSPDNITVSSGAVIHTSHPNPPNHTPTHKHPKKVVPPHIDSFKTNSHTQEKFFFYNFDTEKKSSQISRKKKLGDDIKLKNGSICLGPTCRFWHLKKKKKRKKKMAVYKKCRNIISVKSPC